MFSYHGLLCIIYRNKTNISMTKGKKSEKQKKRKQKEWTKQKQKKQKEDKTKMKKERKKKQPNKTNNPQHIYSARSGTERLYFPPGNSL